MTDIGLPSSPGAYEFAISGNGNEIRIKRHGFVTLGPGYDRSALASVTAEAIDKCAWRPPLAWHFDGREVFRIESTGVLVVATWYPLDAEGRAFLADLAAACGARWAKTGAVA